MHKIKRFLPKGNLAITFLISLAISTSAIILLSLTFALIANMSNDPTGNLEIFSFVALLLSGAIGGFSSAKIKKDGALLFSALVALALTLVMLIISVIINGKVSGGAFMNYLCYIGMAIIFSLLGSRESKKKHHKR
jgi:putative membrane protein (TIGR04086 family)